MRVIITCAGNGTRWNNYTGVRKHLLEIDGERLVDRQVRQLRARDPNAEIFVFCRPDAVYDVPGAATVVARPEDMRDGSESVSRLATRRLWSLTENTLFLLGDVWITDDAMDRIVEPVWQWTHYARLSASTTTGKPGPEMFGAQFRPSEHDRYAQALEAAGSWDHWAVYCCYVGKPIVGAHDIRDWGHHVEIADDGTDDFDFADDYERWLADFRHRGPRRVRAIDWEQEWFQRRRVELALGNQKHRKVWEFASIAQAYCDRVPTTRRRPLGLGFGVGKEPMAAWFAAQGCGIVATDRPEQGVWLDRQWAGHKDDMKHDGIVDELTWQQDVIYERADMRDIPAHLHGFDFTWSTSSLEHLGGRAAALNFFKNQMVCLKPGGFAFHTTEVTPFDGGAILDGPDLCILTPSDLSLLREGLKHQGDVLWPVDLRPGTTVADRYVDEEPFGNDPHLNLRLGSVAFTSVLLIASKGGAR